MLALEYDILCPADITFHLIGINVSTSFYSHIILRCIKMYKMIKMGLGKYSLATASAKESKGGNDRSNYLCFVTKFLAQRRCFVGVCSVMCSHNSEKINASHKRDHGKQLFHNVALAVTWCIQACRQSEKIVVSEPDMLN